MSLRFFVDHCVSNLVVTFLRQQGHEILRLGDHIPVESPDAAVIATAQVLDAILVSLNGDFADIVSYPPRLYKGIISLQVRNHPETTSAIISMLQSFLAAHPDMAHYHGTLVLVEPHRIRIRK